MTISKPTILFIAILAVIIFWQQCNNNKVQAKLEQLEGRKPDTSIRTNTVYLPQPEKKEQPYQPIIIKSDAPANVPIQYTTQLSSDVKELSRQLQQLASDFYSVHHYADSITLRDSSGVNVGIVKLADVVSENKILTRSPWYQLRFPITTNTVTIKEPYKPRTQVFAGIGVSGSKENYVSAFEAGLMLKNKRDQLYGLKAGVGTNGSVVYGINSYWPIRLKK